jgi:acylphosphatase
MRRSMLVAKRFVVRGRVQGVGFRFFTEAAAHREGLSGFVRNADDGAVEAEVEGDADAVERFEMAIHRGPRGARVDAVEVIEVPARGRYTGFMVRG